MKNPTISQFLKGTIPKDEGMPASLTTRENSSPDASQKPKRMSVTLAGDATRMLEDLAAAQGITQSEALRKAIATESYIREELSNGSKVLIQKPSLEIREVVFR
jgi:4-aminobutyrate aminotransferase-like enzyme